MKAVQSILLEMEKNHEQLDKTSVYWRKRYEPAFTQVK